MRCDYLVVIFARVLDINCVKCAGVLIFAQGWGIHTSRMRCLGEAVSFTVILVFSTFRTACTDVS